MSAHNISIEASPKRIRVAFNGEVIADSTKAKLLFETGYQPVIYIPKSDLKMESLSASSHKTTCPYKGEASYWTLSASGKREENAAWSYETPKDDVKEIAGHVAFYWGKMSGWWEEDQALLGHARNPHVRIDTLPSSRRVVVEAKGQVLADTKRAIFLFETGHVPRYYIPSADVRMELLQPSAKRTVCPYKGEAGYLDAKIAGQSVAEIAWFYADPFSEVAAIKDHICFYPERVDRIDVAAR